MSNKAGILSVTRTSPHEYDFEIALSETTEETRIHDLVLTATVQNTSGLETDFHHEEERVLSEAKDCIESRLRELKRLQREKKIAIIQAHENSKIQQD